MKLGLVRVREPVVVAQPSKWSSNWEIALRRWLSRHAPAQPTELEDVAEEVFVRLSRYDEATLVKSPQRFVLLVAANVVDEVRGDLQSEGPDREALIEFGEEGDKECSVSTKLVKQVRAAVEKLPERQKRMLLMHVNEGMSYHEIARAYRMTPRLVQRDLARAYANLRAQVDSLALDAITSR
ncbi:RNA polymerase sigma factor [Steroidobacter flavus]|uniref:RNA polymerase sigma factor n=1 Tax=Steroidobacter flavus TaxID=1842136 RepID=A0ABV8T3Q4_9GAMM